MRPAAVGFQCPNCVAEGAKSVRAARTAYGGTPSTNPGLTSMVLIGINVIVFVLIVLTGWRSSPWIDYLALLPEGANFRLSDGSTKLIDGVADGSYWQLVTSMFTHIDIWHIGFNMLALYVLGPQLELALGRLRFLALYLLSGFAGSVMVYWLSAVHGQTIGASGAIFGLMGGLLVVALKMRADVNQLLMWIGLNFLITVVFRGFISWQGHLGGFLGGLALAAILVYAPRGHRSLWQGLGLGAVLVLLLVGVLSRTLVLA